MERFEQEAVWSEKLKSVATLSAGLAHEIKNPLAAIKTFTDYLPRRFGDPVFREKFVRIVSREVEKINTLVQRLLDFAKPATPKIQPVEVGSVVQETVEFLHPMLSDRCIRVQTRCAPAGLVLADPSQLRQVLLNVLLNSLEAMESGGVVRIGAERQNGHVTIAVSDTGPGIPKADLSRVFDPFFTTKPHGTGLGLSVVHRIVSEHQGRVRILSEPGQGTTVQINLPAAVPLSSH
jgi:polar amino acid transport system substrate-binding protein